MKFEWDRRKAFSNFREHRVSFQEASTVFADPLARIHDDPDHSLGEQREMIVGHSSRGSLLLVSFTERGDAVRIISARSTTPNERYDYEKGIL